MRLTWVTRSFLDYRIPVYAALDELCGHQLTVIFNREVTGEVLAEKLRGVLGERAIGLTGELRLATTRRKNITTGFANKGIRIPYQPGLVKALRNSVPEVMLSDGFMQWTYAPLWQRMWHATPHVMCYERTAYTERHCQWYRKLYRKWAMRNIDAYCVNGRLCEEYLATLGTSEERIFVGQMAADTCGLSEAVSVVPSEEIQQLRSTLGVCGRIFLYVGQLISRKGIRQLLEAWKAAALQDATLVIVGEGGERGTLEEFVQANHLRVVFTGRVSYDLIAPYYKFADVFVIPTLEDNWSLVVPEAMSCGLPIACSCYNGCHPELVTAENGWVFDPMDCDATAEMLRSIAKKGKSELTAMGDASRKIVADFTPPKAAERIFAACEMAQKVRESR